MKKFSLGYSPCPNDTYIFHALARGLVRIQEPDGAIWQPDIFLADVEELNARARRAEPDVTKVSLHAGVHILKDYTFLRAGGAMGYGNGPIIVAREPLQPADLRHATIAVPGLATTAALLLALQGHQGPTQPMVFDQITHAVLQGTAEAGVLIHEGRFTYAEHGLHKILDLGQWWHQTHHLPLPLGLIAIKRSLGTQTAQAVQAAIQSSLAHANTHPEAPADYIQSHAQELAPHVIRQHIETFVNDFSMDVGQEGEQAVTVLLEKAFELAGKTMPELPLFTQETD